jgi:subtilisin family serine protease
MRIRALLTAVTVVASLAGTVTAAQAAEGSVLGADRAGAIPGRYIVTLNRPGASALGVGDVVARTAAGYTASMTATEARRLAADPAVRFVEQDRIVRMSGTQTGPAWGLDRIDQRATAGSGTYTPSADGDGVHAYVIDTGIRITHTEFGGRASYGPDFVDGDASAADCNGHGTHVAGTIGGAHYGVAKKVRLVAVRVLDCWGEGTLSGVIAGVDWVTRHAVRPAVANLSLGGDHSASLDAAVQASINSGVTYAVAAGNENVDAAGSSPAGLSAAITVGATDGRDRRASFSNYGGVLDLFAPGVAIKSSVATSDTATAYYSGTSMASPHVAGAAALILDAYPADTPAQVRNLLVAAATTGKVTDRRASADRLLFVPAPPKAPVIATTGLTATVGQAASARLALTASRRGAWSLATGSLPAGLELSAAGVVSGTPTTAGTWTAGLRFTDYVPNGVTRTVTIKIRPLAPVISPAELPVATAGTAYAAQLAVVDGRPGTWSVAAGSLPGGLTLSASGLLSGTPGGPATFTVRFADAWGYVTSRSYTFDVV